MTNSFFDNHLPYNSMTLTGQGQITVVPDTAIIRLGVQTNGDNLSEVQAENAKISQAVLQAIQQLGITDIKTFQYTIEKLYDYENGNRIDKGYSVRNILEIRMNNLNQAGFVIDTAVSNGANVVDLINFEVSDPDVYYQEALNLAVMNAYEKAKSISVNLGLTMDPIPLRITENSNAPIPFSQFSSMREGAFATPIEPGNKQINASVTVEFLY